MSYNFLDSMHEYTDQLSFELISKTLLETNLMNYSTVRSGLKAGTTSINLVDLVDSTDPAASWVSDRACGWETAGQLDYSQVDITMVEKQTKQALCPTDLRDYYLSEKLSASAHAEEVPFAEVISNLFVKKIKNYNEAYFASLLITQVEAGSTRTSGQSSASDAETILADVYAVIDQVDPAFLNREDLTVVMSPSYFNLLRRALVSANLYHIAPTDSNEMLDIPGTGFKAVKGTFATADINTIIAGPMKDFVIGVGLEDDFDTLKIFYSQDNDEVRVMAAWRMGAAIVEAAAWAYNGL